MPNPNTHTQSIVNTLQLQRNAALDNVVSIQADLAVAKEEIEDLNKTIDELDKRINELNKTIDTMIRDQLPDTSGVPIA